jgi:hypothetical protein
MTNKNIARETVIRLRIVREGRVSLNRSVVGYKAHKFFLFGFVEDEQIYYMITGTPSKITIQNINLVCSADDDYMLTQICMQMAKRGYQYLNGIGFRKWPCIYDLS